MIYPSTFVTEMFARKIFVDFNSGSRSVYCPVFRSILCLEIVKVFVFCESYAYFDIARVFTIALNDMLRIRNRVNLFFSKTFLL